MALLGPLVPAAAAAVTVGLAGRQAPTLPRAATYQRVFLLVPASSPLRCCCWHLVRPAVQ